MLSTCREDSVVSVMKANAL